MWISFGKSMTTERNTIGINPFTFENLTWAAKECMKGVQWKNGTARWRMNLLGNCRKLETELASGRYRQGKSNTFMITSPKAREVTSMLFRDRVVHKVICHQGGLIEDMFRNAYICNTACQTNKGTSFAIRLLDRQLHEFHRLYGPDGIVLDLDIRHFFDSIPHDKLVEWIYHHVRIPMIRKMTADIVNGYPGDRGIGLGSEVSQVLANSYLTPVDYVVKQQFCVRHYVRYADNLICLIPPVVKCVGKDGQPVDVDGREFARALYDGIRYAVSTLGLELNAKSNIHPLGQGIHFLGFRWRLTRTGRVVRTILPSSISREKRKLRRLLSLYREGKRTAEQILDSFQSWSAYAAGATSRKAIERMKDNLEEILPNENHHARGSEQADTQCRGKR